MIDSFPSYFHTNISFFILFGVIVISTLLSYYLYRKTTPPISRFWRTFLSILRAMSISGILILLFSPEITGVWYQNQEKNIVIALDRSSSMGITEAGMTRFNRAKNFASKLADKFSDMADTELYLFNSDTMHGTIGNSDSTFGGTDYSRLISNFSGSEETVDNLIILTDGNLTMGSDPLYLPANNSPVISTVGYGDTTEVADLLILDVKANEIIYEGKPTQLQVELMVQGTSEATITLTVKQNNRTISAENVKLGDEGSILSRNLEIIPEKTGLNRYVIEISGLENEKNIANNKFVKTINVKKGKIKTGLIASKIDFDTKFLISLLNQNDEIDFMYSVINANKSPFFNNVTEVVNNAEVLVLYNFPSGSRYRQEFSILTQKKKPVLIIFNDLVTPERIEFIKQFLPVTGIRNAGQIFQSQVIRTMTGKLFPQLNMFDSEVQNTDFWEKCPPLMIPYSKIDFGNGVDVLLETRSTHSEINSTIPVLLSYKNPRIKSMALFGSGFWRWHFSLAEDKEYHMGWSQFLKNMIRWLGSGSKDKNVILSTTKKTYEHGEYITSTTQVYDGSYNAIDDALVRTEISGPGGEFEIDNERSGPGNYSGRFMAFAEGEYRIKTTAFKNDIELGRDSLSILVIPVNREFMYTNQNYLYLKQLSEKFNGKYYHEDQSEDLLSDLDLTPNRQRTEETMELWHMMIMLIIIICLLTLEWFIRKRLGLA